MMVNEHKDLQLITTARCFTADADKALGQDLISVVFGCSYSHCD
jgi:hypothetical protein